MLVAESLACSNIRIQGGRFRHPNQYGIVLGVGENAVTGFEVSNALIEGLGGEDSGNLSIGGLLVQNGAEGIVVGNKITKCRFSGIVEQNPSTDNLFIANRLLDNGSASDALVLASSGSSQAIRNATNPTRTVSDTGGFRQTIDGWNLDNVAASQTNFELTRAVGRFRAVRAGSLTGVVVTSTEPRSTGTLTVTAFLNSGTTGAAGSTTGLAVSLDGSEPSKRAATRAEGVTTFAPGDELYLVVTTTSDWAPTTADIRCALEIED